MKFKDIIIGTIFEFNGKKFEKIEEKGCCAGNRFSAWDVDNHSPAYQFNSETVVKADSYEVYDIIDIPVDLGELPDFHKKCHHVICTSQILPHVLRLILDCSRNASYLNDFWQVYRLIGVQLWEPLCYYINENMKITHIFSESNLEELERLCKKEH